MIDPITLLTVGPSVIRAIGGLFGGKTKDVADTVAGIADKVRGLPADRQQQEFANQLNNLPPDALVELKKIALESDKIKAEQEQAKLAAQTEQHAQSMETIRTEAIHGTDYVKETRPTIARRSFIAGTVYVLLAEGVKLATDLVHFFNQPDITNQVQALSEASTTTALLLQGADPAIAGILYGPCVWYMTMRTADAFSTKGKT